MLAPGHEQLGWFVILVLAALWGIQHVGFFADDYIFLDAARRMPVDRVLLGQHGIYPWYRPIARELYFYGALLAGPYGRAFTLGLSAVTTAVATYGVFRIGSLLGSRSAGYLAAVLFLTHDLTRFLTAWASGYQDLLSACLVVWAVLFQLKGRTKWALGAAMLAPFAKETGIIGLPLILVVDIYVRRRAPSRRLLLGVTGAALCIGLVNLLVRLTWSTAGSSIPIRTSPSGLIASCAQALRWFLSPPATWAPMALVSAAAAVAAYWRVSARRDADSAPPARATAAALLVPVAAMVLGLAPLIGGNFLHISVPKAYYAFPAVSWSAIFIGMCVARLSSRSAQVIGGILLASNILGLAYRPPDLESDGAWIAGQPSWREAVRLSTATARFAGDLRTQLQDLPRAGVVLYSRFPTGSFFMQSADGATTRELLGDASLSAYFLSEAPPNLDLDRTRIVAFDSRSHHLRLVPRDWRAISASGMQRLAVGEPKSAGLLFGYALPRDQTERDAATYFRTNAAICRYGPDFVALHARSSAEFDSLNRVVAERMAQHLTPGSSTGLLHAQEDVIRSPFSARARFTLADSLFARGEPLRAGVELRVATALVPATGREHYQIGLALLKSGAGPLALPELRLAAADASSPESARLAQRLVLELSRKPDRQ